MYNNGLLLEELDIIMLVARGDMGDLFVCLFNFNCSDNFHLIDIDIFCYNLQGFLI